MTAVSTQGGSTLSFAYTPSGSGTKFFLIRATEEDGQRVWTAPIWVEVAQ